MDFSGEEVHGIFKVISAILKLGNLNFVPTTNMDGTEGCAISNDYGKCKFKFFYPSFQTFVASLVRTNQNVDIY